MDQSLVLQLFADGKYCECINTFLAADYYELSITEQKLFAKCYLLTNRFNKSVEIYQQLVTACGLDTEVYCNIARAYLSLGDVLNSMKYYHLLENISPSFPPMCRGLAIAYSVQGDYNNAIKYSKKFENVFTGDTYSVADTYYQVYLSLGDLDKANSLINGLGYQQSDSRFVLLRVKAYVRNNNFKDALFELGDLSDWANLGDEFINIGLQSLISTSDSRILLALKIIKHNSIFPIVRRLIVEYLYNNRDIGTLTDFLRLSLVYKCVSTSYYSYSASIMLDINTLDIAESLSLESFSQESSNPVCALQLSIVYCAQSNYSEALKYALLSLSLDPHMAQTKLELTNIYCKLGNFGKACLYSLELIEERKLTQDAFSNLVSILERAELYSVALSVLNLDICDILPPAKALQTANLLRKLDDPEQAVIFAKESIDLNPESSKAWSNYSAILWDLGYEQESLDACMKSLSFGESIDALNNHSSINIDLGRYALGLSSIDKVLSINPTHSNCNFLKGSIKLMEMDFVSGWHHYSFRPKVLPDSLATLPLYAGESSGRLLVLREQGIGDEVTFAQCYANILINNSLSVDIECDKRLNSLFTGSFVSLDNRLRFIDMGMHSSNSYDYYIFSGDLMAHYRSHINDFSLTSGGYLRVDSPDFPFPGIFRRTNKKLVGLSWKTQLKRHMNRKNCLDLVKMLTPLKDKNLTYVCLQYGDVLEDIEMVRKTLGVSILTIEDLDLYNDIDGLACLTNQCDVVYTTPNVTVGLSGAIGKETHLLLPSGGPRWRWGCTNGPSYMFNKVYVHRQDHLTGDWGQAIESACSMLI